MGNSRRDLNYGRKIQGGVIGLKTAPGGGTINLFKRLCIAPNCQSMPPPPPQVITHWFMCLPVFLAVNLLHFYIFLPLCLFIFKELKNSFAEHFCWKLDWLLAQNWFQAKCESTWRRSWMLQQLHHPSFPQLHSHFAIWPISVLFVQIN